MTDAPQMSPPRPTEPPPPPPPPAGATVVPAPRSAWPRRLAGALALVLALVAGLWVLGRAVPSLNPFSERTVERTGPAVLTALRDVKQFHAATGYYEIVVDQERSRENLPSILTGERVLFVAAGTVDATVDFSRLGSGQVQTSPDRTSATIRLARPSVSEARLDLSRSYVADHDRGLTERIEDAIGKTGSQIDTREVYRLAQQRLTEAGRRNDELSRRAEANTRAMLTSLLGSLGYRSVTVTFGPAA